MIERKLVLHDIELRSAEQVFLKCINSIAGNFARKNVLSKEVDYMSLVEKRSCCFWAPSLFLVKYTS